MLVEDEPDILAIYTVVLHARKIRVFTARNGQEALDFLVSGQAVDLILLDIMLPKVDGLMFLKDLRQKPALKCPPVILLTNLPDREIIGRCYDLGALGTIIKSDINPNELLPRIRAILKESGAERISLHK